MSTAAAKRDKRKKIKPRLSFGSSSGACSNLPSNMQANFQDLFALLKRQQQAHADEPHFDANGNTTGWSAHKDIQKDSLLMYSEPGPGSARSSPDSAKLSDGKEPAVDNFRVSEGDTGSVRGEDVPAVDEKPEFQALTDADVADIVRQLRDFLQETGPSQEDDLLKVLSPQQARQVLSEYRTLANFVDRHPGFRQLHEELHSFLYYQDPEDDDDDYYSTPAVAPGGAHNGLQSSACKVDQELEQPAVAGDGGPRGARASSCSSTSYESAVEDEVEEKVVSLKDGCSQTPSRPRCLSRAMQAVQPTCDAETQTHGWDLAQFAELELMLKEQKKKIAELEEGLASQQEDHAREMQQFLIEMEKLENNRAPVTPSPQSLPLQNENHVMDEEGEDEDERPRGAVSTIEAEDFGGEEGQCQLPPALPSPPPPLLLRRKSSPVRAEPEDVKLHALSIEPRPPSAEHKGRRPVERLQVPEFYDLHWRMEQAAPCSDVESMYSSRAASPTKSKTEQQIAKIVHMVKKQQPNYSEQEVRRHVDVVRRSQGGFSRMTFNSIVALVLSHMKSVAAATTTRNKH